MSHDGSKSVCLICLNTEQPRARTTRNVKNDLWICCDCCNSWFHSSCGGYTSNQYTKIQKDCIWIKCIVCCLQQIQSTVYDPESSKLNSLVEEAVNKRLQDSSVRKTNKRKKSQAPVQVSTNPASASAVEEHQSGNLQADKTQVNTDGITVIEESPSDKSQADKILIIDDINNPVQYSSSKRILQEINFYCPQVKVDFAYSLAKGGVAIHTKCKSDRDLLATELPAESFGGGIRHPPRNKSCTSLYIKRVDTSLDTIQITQHLRKEGINTIEVRRLTKRITGKPTQVVKVKCDWQSAEILMNVGFVVNNKRFTVERERAVRVVRCFHCQSLGHLARHCINVRHCEFCADTHGEEQKCSRGVQCFNCHGKHPSSSSKCPVYTERYATLAEQHAESKYLHAIFTPSSGEVKH